MVLISIKKREEKDQASTSILRCFLRKLEKSKGYILIKDSKKVKNLDQTFKVFKGGVFDEKIHTLADISDILRSLSERESLKLEYVNRIIKDYNLCS